MSDKTKKAIESFAASIKLSSNSKLSFLAAVRVNEARLILAELTRLQSLVSAGTRGEGLEEGKVWSAIRTGLTNCREDIKGAANAGPYELESAYFDSIARDLTQSVIRSLSPKAMP